jgi:hypothetical protein
MRRVKSASASQWHLLPHSVRCRPIRDGRLSGSIDVLAGRATRQTEYSKHGEQARLHPAFL